MRSNNGKATKKIVLIVPESTEVMDITYYWKTAGGMTIKTDVILADSTLEDGKENICYSFPNEGTDIDCEDC